MSEQDAEIELDITSDEEASLESQLEPQPTKKGKKPIRNGLFGGIDVAEIRELEREVTRAIPLWSFVPTGGGGTKPVASLLVIVSTYGTVLAVTDAVVPVLSECDGKMVPMVQHYRYRKDGKMAAPFHKGTPLALLRLEQLHYHLKTKDRHAAQILGDEPVPEILKQLTNPESGAGYRLIRVSRRPAKNDPSRAVQVWEIFTVDETKLTQWGEDKEVVDPRQQTLEYTFNSPPLFELEETGFMPDLFRDISRFLNAPKIVPSVTTAERYLAYREAVDGDNMGQFFTLFREEEKQRQAAAPMIEVPAQDPFRDRAGTPRPERREGTAHAVRGEGSDQLHPAGKEGKKGKRKKKHHNKHGGFTPRHDDAAYPPDFAPAAAESPQHQHRNPATVQPVYVAPPVVTHPQPKPQQPPHHHTDEPVSWSW